MLITFDFGGTIDTNPSSFEGLIQCFYRSGNEVAMVTGVLMNPDGTPTKEELELRMPFAVKIRATGINFPIHFCNADRRGGITKAQTLKSLNADIHFDNDKIVADQIKQECPEMVVLLVNSERLYLS